MAMEENNSREEYVRIGTTLFRILNQPMMNGTFRKMRVDHPVADTIFLVGYGFFIVCAVHENVHVGFAVWELVDCFSL